MKRNIYIDFGYLVALAASYGAVMVLGVLVAPVVFHANEITVALEIDNYNSGIIMGEIFHRFSKWVYILAFMVLAYEAMMYKKGQRDIYILFSSTLVIFTSLMFSAVYSPKILEMQAMGAEATQSDTFANLHLASEVDFKILAFSLVVLFIRRLMLMKI